MKTHVVSTICMLLISSLVGVSMPQVYAVELISITITVAAVGVITTHLTLSQFYTFKSILASSGYSHLFPFPRPLVEPHPPLLRWESIMIPYDDTGRRLFEALEKAKTTADAGRKLAEVIIRYMEDRRAGVRGVLSIHDCSGYYLCEIRRIDNNGFRETWLIWARWPRETTSIILIGISDIASPSIQVISPNGGERWAVGETRRIQWSASDNYRVERIDIFYSTNGGRSWLLVAERLNNTGYYDWRVPDTPSTNSLLRIVAYDAAGNTGADRSDRTFTIVRPDTTPPTVRVTSPNGGEVWRVGEIRQIRWSALDNVQVTRIDIFYSTDGGRTWSTIATGLRNTGSYVWRIPNTPSTNCLVRVDAYDTAGNRGTDASDRPFTIRR